MMFGRFFKVVVKGARAEDQAELQYILNPNAGPPVTTSAPPATISSGVTQSQTPTTSVAALQVTLATSVVAQLLCVQPVLGGPPPRLAPVPPAGPGQPAPMVFKPQLDTHFDSTSDNVRFFSHGCESVSAEMGALVCG